MPSPDVTTTEGNNAVAFFDVDGDGHGFDEAAGNFQQNTSGRACG